MNKLAINNTVKAKWIEPTNGNATSIDGVTKTGAQSFTTPDGWEDALLILEASSN
jgi:hypothetical protein